MATWTYPLAMADLKISEGGYVNHPKDPGGATNIGVTQAVYDEYRVSKGLPKRSVRLITEAEVAEIYKTRYADKVRYDELPAGVDYATFDAAVNSGVWRGSKWLQKALGVAQDGIVGKRTVAASKATDPVKIVKAICSTRTSFVSGLGTFKVFGSGWLSRIARVEAKSVKMAMEKRGTSAASLKIALGVEADVATKNSKSAATTSKVSGVGAGGSAYQVDWANLTAFESAILILIAAGFVALVVYLIHRSRQQKARADAYAAIASEGATA